MYVCSMQMRRRGFTGASCKEEGVASPRLGADELRLPDLMRNRVLPSMGKRRLRLAVEEEDELAEISRSMDAPSLLRDGVDE